HHHHRMHHRRMHHRGHGMAALHKLDLTDTQRTNIHQLMRDSHQTSRTSRKAMWQKRMALRNATPGTPAYRNAATALANAVAEAAKARVMRRADLQVKIYAELTPEQRTKLADMQASRMDRMKKWRAEHK